MITTLYLMAEQVLSLLVGGKPDAASPHTMPEIKKMLVALINTRLKADYVQTTLGSGERIPDGSIKATYENVVVEQYRGKARCFLPVQPISLPHNMGVWEITPQDDIDCQFIPMPSGQRWMIQKETLLNRVLDQHGYEVNGREVLFTDDITALDDPITEVAIRLVVGDINQMGDYDPLPIPSDMEALVIKDCFELLTNKRPTDGVNNLSQDKTQMK